MRHLMTRLGLTVNETKTRLARLPEENFDFLGYSIGRFYGKDGCRIPARARPGRLFGACSSEFTTRRRHTSMPRAQNYGLPLSIASSAAGPSIQTKGRFFRPTSWCSGMSNGVFNAGWCDERTRGHRIPPVSGRVSLRDTRPIRLAETPHGPAEREGLMTQEKAGCGKSACPV